MKFPKEIVDLFYKVLGNVDLSFMSSTPLELGFT